MRKTIPAIVLCALAGAASAVPAVHEFGSSDLRATIYTPEMNDTGNTAQNAFDGDVSTGVGVPAEGYSVVADFSGWLCFRRVLMVSKTKRA